MTSFASRGEAVASALATIIDGRPWIAAPIRNPRLRKYCHQLNRTFSRPGKIADLLRSPCRRLFSCVAHGSDLIGTAHRLRHDCVPALLRVAAYAPAWIHPPEEWFISPSIHPDEQWRDLLRHLFCQWPLPRFFDNAWQVRGSLRSPERDWFCHLARGGSWRKADGVPPEISRQAFHLAMEAPGNLRPRAALRWGQLAALKASPALVAEVLASRMVDDLRHEAVWSRLLAKVADSATFDPRDFPMIADTVCELLSQRHVNRACSLVSQPLADLREHCRSRWAAILRAAEAEGLRFRQRDPTRAGLRNELRHVTRSAWEPMQGVRPLELRRKHHAGSYSIWSIREQCSHALLTSEGRAMGHCVAGYWRRCLRGCSSIFTLRRRVMSAKLDCEIPHVTIEVDKRSRRIVQARGKSNCLPSVAERRLIELWAERNQLRMAV